MTPDERERLASLIAAEIERSVAPAAPTNPGATWLPIPVRPEPPPPAGAPPDWSGAAQSLGDLAPVRHPVPSAHRADAAEATAAVRAAAAGHGTRRSGRSAPSATTPHREGGGPRSASTRRHRAGPIDVPVGVSRRHVHLSEAHVRALFGVPTLEVLRTIRQPGQFAARQQVVVVGPKGRLDDVRVVGPARGETQVELARSDAARLGIDPPLAASGSLEKSLGGVTLVGPHGRVELARGVIIAARHLHLAPADAARWGMQDGDRLDIRCGSGARAVTWHDVLVRAGAAHATEFHLDDDEAHAAGVGNGCSARIVGWQEARSVRRILVTERELVERVRRGEPIPNDALFTPGARDRARSLGLDLP